MKEHLLPCRTLFNTLQNSELLLYSTDWEIFSVIELFLLLLLCGMKIL